MRRHTRHVLEKDGGERKKEREREKKRERESRCEEIGFAWRESK